MSRFKFSLLLAALSMAIVAEPVVAQSSPSTSPSSPSASQTSPSSSPASSMSQSLDSQTFTGKIAKAGAKYVLKDDKTRTSYTLDDQDQAKQFEGKSVKVTGNLDASSNTIHVATIEPGS